MAHRPVVLIFRSLSIVLLPSLPRGPPPIVTDWRCENNRPQDQQTSPRNSRMTTESGPKASLYCPLLGGLKPSPLGEGFSRYLALRWVNGRMPIGAAYRFHDSPAPGVGNEVSEARVGRRRWVAGERVDLRDLRAAGRAGHQGPCDLCTCSTPCFEQEPYAELCSEQDFQSALQSHRL